MSFAERPRKGSLGMKVRAISQTTLLGLIYFTFATSACSPFDAHIEGPTSDAEQSQSLPSSQPPPSNSETSKTPTIPTSPPEPTPIPPPAPSPTPPPPPQPTCQAPKMEINGECLAELVIHMDPKGDDQKNGLTDKKPILSVTRAQEVIKELEPTIPVTILIQPGTYEEQAVLWKYFKSGQSISFKAAESSQKPVFDGCPSGPPCKSLNWFASRIAPGEDTNFHFINLHIKNYRYAISINSNRNKPERRSSNNLIEGCIFERIGNVFDRTISPSTGAIVLVNSIRNTIRKNSFVNVTNTTKPNLLHSIYLAHQSSENLIEENRFEGTNPDPVRIRDSSNYNLVRKNYFGLSSRHVFSDWYCDKETRTDCTKSTAECPSYGNVIEGNYRSNNPDYRVSAIYQDDVSRYCDPIPPGEKRLTAK